jgi:hypothetical protein
MPLTSAAQGCHADPDMARGFALSRGAWLAACGEKFRNRRGHSWKPLLKNAGYHTHRPRGETIRGLTAQTGGGHRRGRQRCLEANDGLLGEFGENHPIAGGEAPAS